MDAPEDIGINTGVFFAETGEKSADGITFALFFIRAVVGHRSDPGGFQPGDDHLVGEVVKGTNYHDGAGEK